VRRRIANPSGDRYKFTGCEKDAAPGFQHNRAATTIRPAAASGQDRISSLLQIGEYLSETAAAKGLYPPPQLFVGDGRLNTIVKGPLKDLRGKKIPNSMPLFVEELREFSAAFQSDAQGFIHNKLGHN
jgi:hypothetical protein